MSVKEWWANWKYKIPESPTYNVPYRGTVLTGSHSKDYFKNLLVGSTDPTVVPTSMD